jgi:hypothetical protein
VLAELATPLPIRGTTPVKIPFSFRLDPQSHSARWEALVCQGLNHDKSLERGGLPLEQMSIEEIARLYPECVETRVAPQYCVLDNQHQFANVNTVRMKELSQLA